MKQAKKSEEIGYKIIKIHTTKFGFLDNIEDSINDLFSKKGALDLIINSSLNIDDKTSIITIDISTKLTDKLKNNILVEHTGRTAYHMKNIDKVYNAKTNSYELPDNLVIQLYSIAYTHTRALLATELSPTAYKDKYFLPVINPVNFIKQIKNDKNI